MEAKADVVNVLVRVVSTVSSSDIVVTISLKLNRITFIQAPLLTLISPLVPLVFIIY